MGSIEDLIIDMILEVGLPDVSLEQKEKYVEHRYHGNGYFMTHEEIMLQLKEDGLY